MVRSHTIHFIHDDHRFPLPSSTASCQRRTESWHQKRVTTHTPRNKNHQNQSQEHPVKPIRFIYPYITQSSLSPYSNYIHTLFYRNTSFGTKTGPPSSTRLSTSVSPRLRRKWWSSARCPPPSPPRRPLFWEKRRTSKPSPTKEVFSKNEEKILFKSKVTKAIRLFLTQKNFSINCF